MNAQLKESITPAALIAGANHTITCGINYRAGGNDAQYDVAAADATLLIELALDKDEAFACAVRAFLIGALTLIHKSYNSGSLGNAHWQCELEEQPGKRYIRIVKGTAIAGTGTQLAHKDLSWSAYCFIDKTNGNVLKAAGWKAPAKHARGNIFDSSNGVDAVTAYGARYL